MEDKEFKLERGTLFREFYHNDRVRWESPSGKDVNVRVANYGLVFPDKSNWVLGGVQIGIYRPHDVEPYRLGKEKGFQVSKRDLEIALLQKELTYLEAGLGNVDSSNQRAAMQQIHKLGDLFEETGPIYKSMHPGCEQDASNYEVLHFISNGELVYMALHPSSQLFASEKWNEVEALKDLRPEPEGAKRILTAMLE